MRPGPEDPLTMATSFRFETRRLPTRVAELGFAVDLPPTWWAHDLPDETPNFEDPTTVLVLALVTSPDEKIVWSAAVRPAYADGTLDTWTKYLLRQAGLGVKSLSNGRLGSMTAIVGEAEQRAEDGPRRLRFAFVEDGQRLINVSLSAPASRFDEVAAVWEATASTFALSHPQGASVALSKSAPPPAPGETTIRLSKNTFARHALAADMSALESSHPFYVAARVAGRGRAARVAAVDPDKLRATLALGSILAQVDVPFGWHALDDARFFHLHAVNHKIRVRMSFLADQTGDPKDHIDAIEEQVATDAGAGVRFTRVQRGARLALRIDGLREAGRPVQELHQLTPGPEAGRLLHAMSVADLDVAEAAADLVDILLQSVVYGKFELDASAKQLETDEAPAAGSADHPSWWLQAMQLERSGEIAEAEQVILAANDPVRGLLQVARLYRDRALRLARRGDTRGAQAASEIMERWAERHAATATTEEQTQTLAIERSLTLMRE